MLIWKYFEVTQSDGVTSTNINCFHQSDGFIKKVEVLYFKLL